MPEMSVSLVSSATVGCARFHGKTMTIPEDGACIETVQMQHPFTNIALTFPVPITPTSHGKPNITELWLVVISPNEPVSPVFSEWWRESPH